MVREKVKNLLNKYLITVSKRFKYIHSHKLIEFPILLIILYLLGYFLLVISYCLPVDPIRDHIREDYISVVAVGEWIPGHDDTIPDYYTDSLMLLEAEYDSKVSPFISAIRSTRPLMQDANYVYETYLRYNEDNNIVFYEYDYLRYWHGYLIFLKPLLVLFSLGSVKYLMLLFQVSLLVLFVYCIVKAGLKFRYVVPVFAAYLYMNPVTLGMSFQYNCIFSITMVSIIILLRDHCGKKDIENDPLIYFFMIGVTASFFDLLTYPLVSLGVPMIYYFLLYSANNKKDYLSMIKIVLSWGVGYGGMWAGKWILAYMLIGREVLYDIQNSISVRSGFDASESFSGEYISYLDVIERNMSVQSTYGFLFLMILVVVIAYRLIRFRTIMVESRKRYGFMCILVGLAPFLWYFLLPNHSWIHYWFTYRTLALSICSIIMFSIVENSGKTK